jgi:predicted small metal-binding protein
MTGGSRVALACRDLGFACEWATEGTSPEDLAERARAHYACAHPSFLAGKDADERLRQAVHPLA